MAKRNIQARNAKQGVKYKRVTTRSSDLTVTPCSFSDRAEVWYQLPTNNSPGVTAFDLFEDLKKDVRERGLESLTARALNMYQRMCRMYPQMTLLERVEHAYTEHHDNALYQRSRLVVVPSTTMLTELVTPEAQINDLTTKLTSWDTAICKGQLSEAKRHALYICVRVAARGLRPKCYPGLWQGFVSWCQSHNIKAASSLMQGGAV